MDTVESRERGRALLVPGMLPKKPRSSWCWRHGKGSRREKGAFPTYPGNAGIGGMERKGGNSIGKHFRIQFLIPPLPSRIPGDSRGFSLGSSHGGHGGSWILAPAVPRGQFQEFCGFDPIFSVDQGDSWQSRRSGIIWGYFS